MVRPFPLSPQAPWGGLVPICLVGISAIGVWAVEDLPSTSPASQTHYQPPFSPASPACSHAGACPPYSFAPSASTQTFCLRGSVHPKRCSQLAQPLPSPSLVQPPLETLPTPALGDALAPSQPSAQALPLLSISASHPFPDTTGPSAGAWQPHVQGHSAMEHQGLVQVRLSEEAAVLLGCGGAPAELGCGRHVWSLNKLNTVVATASLPDR